jgi:hypothetical protein
MPIEKSVADPSGFGNLDLALGNHFDHNGDQKARDCQSGPEHKKDQSQSTRHASRRSRFTACDSIPRIVGHLGGLV